MSNLDQEPIRLTETVAKGGCAAKLPAGELRKILNNLYLPRAKELLIGTETMDDACLWDLGNGSCLVQTLDFFTPIVDDARDFGAIAAANAMSDIYAMGGTPRIALTILAFPSAHLPLDLLNPLMDGAISKINEAGACLAGGHTIDDESLKLGFSVSGFVDKDSVWSNAGAKPGDFLILTKGLGTGTLSSALKAKKLKSEWLETAVASMTSLNACLDLVDNYRVHAATDVTGFGLCGHLLQLCRASQVQAEIDISSLPTLPGVYACLEQKILNKAHYANFSYVKDAVSFSRLSETEKWLTLDPQTSGGLLLSVPAEDAELLLQRLQQRFPKSAIIGRIQKGEGIIFEN